MLMLIYDFLSFFFSVLPIICISFFSRLFVLTFTQNLFEQFFSKWFQIICNNIKQKEERVNRILNKGIYAKFDYYNSNKF